MEFEWEIGEALIKEHFEESYDWDFEDDSNSKLIEIPAFEESCNKDSEGFFDDSSLHNHKETENDELPLPGECLFGLHNIALAAEIIWEHDYIISKRPISFDFDMIFSFIDNIKRSIVYLNHSIDRDDDSVSNSVYEYIETCRSVYNRNMSILRDDVTIPVELMKDHRLNAIAERILLYVQDSKNERQPYGLYEELVCSLPGMEDRRVLVKAMRPVHRYFSENVLTDEKVEANYYGYYPRGEGDTNALTCQMVLKKESYIHYIQVAKSVLNRLCNIIGSKYAHIQSYNDYLAFVGSIDNLKKDISKLANGNDFKSTFGKYLGDDKNHNRCYGLLHYGEDKYVSLSGNWDAQDTYIQSWLGLSDNTIKNRQDIIDVVNRVIQNDPLLHGSLYSEVNDDTVSYTPFRESIKKMTGKQSKSIVPYKYIAFPVIKYGKILRYSWKVRSISCCERKMISKASPSNRRNSFLFTRHKPCSECQQAISEFRDLYGTLQVFYFNEDKEHPTDKMIHEYC